MIGVYSETDLNPAMAVRLVEKVRADSTACCENCSLRGGGENRLLLCKACRAKWYCGAECQKAHWKVHKRACQQQVEAAKLGSERLLRVERAMGKWIARFKPALRGAGLFLLLPSIGGVKEVLLETHTFVVEVKETPHGSGEFELVSTRVEPMEYLKRCLVPGIYNDLIEEVRGEAEREKLSIRAGRPVVGSMVTCVMCWDGDECVRLVAPTGITIDNVERIASWPFDPNWAETLKDRITNYRYFAAPDRSMHAVSREQLAKLEKKSGKTKSGFNAA